MLNNEQSGEFIDPYVVIENARQQALNQIIYCFAMVGATGGPLSVARTVVTGWQTIYAAHIVISAGAIVLWLLSKKLPYNTKFWSLIAVMWSIGTAGLIQYGMLGSGTWWLACSALLGGILVSRHVGLLLAGAAITLTCLVAYCYTTGIIALRPSIEVSDYMTSPITWAAYLVTVVWLPIIIFTSFSQLSSLIACLAKETADTQAELYKMASVDALTGAVRPHILHSSLEYELLKGKRSREGVGVIFIDLDNFKPVNDSYGHAVGDAILVEVVKRARSALREEDIIARIGGDEFIVAITGVTSEESLVKVAEKLQSAVQQRFCYQGIGLEIGISIGVACSLGNDLDVKQLISAADQRMYRDKRGGRTPTPVPAPLNHGAA